MTLTLWVEQDAPSGGDGSAEHPFSTIQDALDMAEPGTVVMVRAGTYEENIDFSSGGREGADITLMSADGVGAAIITAADPHHDTIQIDGHDHITIDGFELHGSHDPSRQIVHIHAVNGNGNPASHITISNNTLHRGEGDGIKVSKSTEVLIIDNVIKGGGSSESAIDIVGGVRAVIDGNVIVGSPKIGIMVKGGSQHIAIANNALADIGGNAIEVGGYSNLAAYPPGFLDAEHSFEASNVRVHGNTIADSGSWALRLIGVQGVEVSHNAIHGTGARIAIDDSAKFHEPWFSHDVAFFDNQIADDAWLVDRSAEAEPILHENEGGVFSMWDSLWAAEALETNTIPPEADLAAADTADLQEALEDEPNDPVEEGELANTDDLLHSQEVLYTGTDPGLIDDIGASATAKSTFGGDGLKGTALDDTINAQAGNDYVKGGAGDDVILGETGDDRLEGGRGDDTLSGGSHDDDLRGGSGNDRLYGGTGKDHLRGQDGHDTLLGGDGDDRLFGNSGADLLFGGDGKDELRGGKGEDWLEGATGDDRLSGNDGSDTILGGAGDDTLKGSSGDDLLEGGAGDDVLLGGQGADHFHFRAGAAFGHDWIDRFETDNDVLVLEGFGAFSDLDSNGDGVIDATDAIAVSTHRGLALDLTELNGSASGTSIICISSEALTAEDFVFLL